jgi:allantoicase
MSFDHLIDLAQPRLGAEVVYATDDFFADKSRLIDPAEPQFIVGKYDDNGKWMDGWESRRKRGPGYDFCVVKLGRPGTIAGFEIDTCFFTGNYPPAASIEACHSDATIPGDECDWVTLVPTLGLKGNDRAVVAADPAFVGRTFTHVRLNIFPDGGVARLRVFGAVTVDWSKAEGERIDLLAMENGGKGLIVNDQHYGKAENLTAPGRGVDMGDGWETRRRREPGNDWAIVELGAPGVIEEVIVDTAHFKGNYPDRCWLQASLAAEGPPEAVANQSMFWPVLLPEQKLQADTVHSFTEGLAALGPVKFVRLNIVPDGGVSRLRLIGRVSAARQL